MRYYLILTLAILLSACSTDNNSYTKKELKSLFGNGSIEDANSRLTYELERRKDPATGLIPLGIAKRSLLFGSQIPKINTSRSNSWFSKGPNNFGGRTRAIALDILDEDIIIAGGVTGGIWKSVDGGQSFTKKTMPSQLHSITSIAQDLRSGKENVWYAGTGEYYGIISAASFSNRASGNGIFKSTDKGETWQALPSTQSNTPTTHVQNGDFDFVWDVVTDHTNVIDDVVLAAVYNGIYRSADGGSSWNIVLGLDTTIAGTSDYVSLEKSESGVFYAGLSSGSPGQGIWRSEDGINWTDISPNLPSGHNRIEIAISTADEDQVFFIINAPGSGSTGHQLWKYRYLSGNGSGLGGKWINKTNFIPNEPCNFYSGQGFNFDFGPYNSQSSYNMCLEIHPTDTNFILLGGTNIYRSIDGFSSNNYDWIGGYICDSITPSNYIYPNHHPDNHQMIFLPSDPDVLISAHDGGVSKTNEIAAFDVNWVSLNNQYNTAQFYTVAIEQYDESDIIIGGLQDNGTWHTSSKNRLADWSMILYGDGAFCGISDDRDYYYLSWQQGRVFKAEIADNGGVLGLERIDPIGASGFIFINPLILHPNNDDYMYLAAGRFIWRNDDLNAIPITGNEYNKGSQGWDDLTITSTGGSVNAPSITTLDMSHASNDLLYYGTSNGSLYRLDDALSASPNQLTNITSPNFPLNAYTSCVEVNRKDAAEVMVSFSNYNVQSIYHSSDSGKTFAEVSGNLEENPDGTGDGPSVTWVHIHNRNDTTIYLAATSTGLYSTSELNGSSTIWKQEGSNTIGNVVINMITSRESDNNIVVATHGNGMYSNQKFVPAVGLDESELLDVKPYPNPFTSILQISNSTNKGLSFLVYSLSGELIYSGRSHQWKPKRDVSKGIYLIKVETGTEEKVFKVLYQ